MDFKVVDIPTVPNTSDSAIIADALIKNPGKAIEVKFGNRDSNSFRKALRACLNTRGILDKYDFHTKANGVTFGDGPSMTVWLETKEQEKGTGVSHG